MSYTVKELMKKLKEHDEDSEVVYGDDEWMVITSVKTDDNEGRQNPVVVIN